MLNMSLALWKMRFRWIDFHDIDGGGDDDNDDDDNENNEYSQYYPIQTQE